MIGKTISHYKIIEKLGEGGMGVVYKAEDTRLKRHVALKFLPEDLTKDADARERFVQEARAASTLDHPNICNIHDIDKTSDGQMFIVMAHYEGESLREKVNRGIISIREAVNIVLQVAEGLNKAHNNDIIHRDIKPANIVVTQDNQVKIVDFGLAKLVGQSNVTKTGTTLGTVRYMSPEQVTGGVVDHRSDIWSLGVVLYELITGRAPFEGDYDQAIAYAIVNEPHTPVSQAKPEVPREFDELINKILAKDPVTRFQDIAGFISELRSIPVHASPGPNAPQSQRPTQKMRRRPLQVWAAVVIAVLVVSLIYSWLSKRSGDPTLPAEKPLERPLEKSPDTKVVETKQITLTQVTFSEELEEYPAFSPDGAQITFCREVDGYKHIFIKNLATGADSAITKGPRDNIQPAWSADGTSIAFVRSNRADGKLEFSDKFGESVGGDIWKYSLDSGLETRLLENAYNPSFSPDGEKIAFDSEWSKTRRIWVADRLGRNAQQITFDPSEAVAHIVPRWSPDGKNIVFQNMDWTKFDIKVVDLETKTMQWVTDDSFQDLNPVWMQSGNDILFSSYRTGGLNVWRIPISNDGAPSGPPKPVTTGAGQDVQLTISPDGSKLAFSILKLNADLWRLPVSPKNGLLAGEPELVVATTREDSRGAWSPDGSAIAFNSDRSGDMNIWIHSLKDGSTQQLTKGPGGDYQANWSPNGKTVAFFSARAGNPDIWVVDVGSGELTQLTRGASLDINPFFSPGGHSIAYQSDQYGRKEVWVMNDDGSNQRQLTDIGVSGHFMLWSPTQRFIYFRSPSTIDEGNARQLSQVSMDGRDPTAFTSVMGGAHISISPRYDMIMDVVGHKKLWVSYVVSHQYHEVFEFSDPDVRIDYPDWSPDGQWILFDYLKPGGGDIWVMEGFE